MSARFVKPALLAALALQLVSPDVRANDSTAILESGQLHLTTSPQIALEREDLYIAPEQVRVRYRFHNKSKKDVTTIVAFPLPAITVSPDFNYEVKEGESVNIVGFNVQVNGKPVETSTQLRATRHGLDQTAILERHGIPILPFDARFHPLLEKAPEAAREELERAGLVDWSSTFGPNNKPYPNAHWTAHVTYYWTQTFPAGAVTEIAHSYRPVAGVSFFYDGQFEEEYFTGQYCFDDGFRRAAKKRFGGSNALNREVHYVLKTGANWLGSIGEFHLTIDKGKPENLVSLCIDDIKKTGPTTFETVRKEFVPEKDLKILFIEPPRAQ